MGRLVRLAVPALLGVLVTGSLTACTSEPAPTDVTVAWADATHQQVRVTWKESGDQPNKVSVDGVAAAPPDIVQYLSADTPNTTLLRALDFPKDGTFRISVVIGSLSGGITSKPGLSPMFDTDGPAAPVLTSVGTRRDGGVEVAWRPGSQAEDFTPGDPLDVKGLITTFVPTVNGAGPYQGRPLAAAGRSQRQVITGVDPPFLFNVRAGNEWGGSYGASVVADTTTTTAVYPRLTVFSLATPIRGRVTRHRLVCHDGACAAAAMPGPGLPVVLQARTAESKPWAAVATTRTRAGGTFYFAPRSPGVRQYRVVSATYTGSPWMAFGSRSGAGVIGARVRVWSRFSAPVARYRQQVTATVRIWPARSVRTTFQRWNGRGWVNVKYVAVRNGVGSYRFTALMRGSYGFRFVVPSVTYAGRTITGYSTRSMVLTTR
jgi:hypothetical protein